MESERAQNFNDRLNQWVAGQGFWFQLKYSMLGSGAGSFQLVQLTFRALIFLLLVAVGLLIYLFKRTDGGGFHSGLQTSLTQEFNAKQLQLGGFQRSQGKLAISSVAATGNEGAFFTEMDARDIGGRMGILDGLIGKWKPGTITVAKLDIDLRAGTQDAASAEKLGDVLFKDREDVDISAIDVEDATISWGFSVLTRGLVENSQLKIRRVGPDWRLQFKGGKFSQNWLKRLDIRELVVICRPDGLLFEKAIFGKGAGTVDMSGLTIIGTERPALNGIAKVRHLPLEDSLPVAAESFFEGKISTDLKITGSTNSASGVGFEGKVTLGTDDEVTLRDRIHLFRALTVVDVFNNYRRVNFRQGSFFLKTGDGMLTIKNVDLKADDLLTLKGSLSVRHPTAQEMRQKIESGPKERSAIFAGEEAKADVESPDEKSPDSSEFTLKRAAKETLNTGKKEEEGPLVNRYDARLEQRKFESQVSDRMAESLRYEGDFEITLRSDAFDRTEKLKLEFPVDEKTGRIHMKVPIEGGLHDLTLTQAEDIYKKGKR